MREQVLTSNVKELRKNRIACFVGAGILGIVMLWPLLMALSAANIMVTTGTVRELYIVVRRGGRFSTTNYYTHADCEAGSPCDASDGDVELRLDGSGTAYNLYPERFSPPLGQWFVDPGAQVRLLFTQAPLLARDVVAVQFFDAQGRPLAIHTTPGYTDPAGSHTTYAILFLGIFACAVGMAWFGIKLPDIAARHPGLARRLDLLD